MKGEWEHLENFSCFPLGSIACSVQQKLLFSYSFFPFLWLQKVDMVLVQNIWKVSFCSPVSWEACTERDNHRLFWDKNSIDLCSIVPGMATDWFSDLLFQPQQVTAWKGAAGFSSRAAISCWKSLDTSLVSPDWALTSPSCNRNYATCCRL